jgi:hypothetical protein
MLKNLPIILLGVTLVAIVCVSFYTDPRNQNEQNSAGNSLPSASISKSYTSDPTQEEYASGQTPIWRMLLAWPEGVTTLAVLLTLFFIAWQAILMRQTITASEDVAKRELRAYLTVVIGAAFFQQRRSDADGGDLRFECRPLIVNTGQTPARNVTFKARAAIMQMHSVKNAHLPEDPDEGFGGSIIGSQQNATMSAVVEDYCADDEVDSIKYARGDKCLLAWGRVTYEDVFGEEHFTRFCQGIYWDLQNNVRGNYIPGRNDAD